MKFNISFMGPDWLYHLRRDFILALKYGLEDLGHDVALTSLQVDKSRFNLIIGAYFLRSDQILKLIPHGNNIAYINTEIIANDMLNHNPDKVDFLGAYLPAMQSGVFVWDVVINNIVEHTRYGTHAHFLRWGWHAKLEDIQHRIKKDLDYYFFGFLTPRRKEILSALQTHGLHGHADHICPYFVRNDHISRAKVQLNIVQDDKYIHVNSFRVCYLANNKCAVISEPEDDPAGYLESVQIHTRDDIADAIDFLIRTDKWKENAELLYTTFLDKPSMKDELKIALDIGFNAR